MEEKKLLRGSYILSDKGFLKEWCFTRGPREAPGVIELEWTQILREAKVFSTSNARNFVAKHNLGFTVWNPWTQDVQKKSTYVLALRQKIGHDSVNEDDLDFFGKAREGTAFWVPVERKTSVSTDFKHLEELQHPSNEKIFQTLKEATDECLRLNAALIADTQERYEKITKRIRLAEAESKAVKYGV